MSGAFSISASDVMDSRYAKEKKDAPDKIKISFRATMSKTPLDTFQ